MDLKDKKCVPCRRESLALGSEDKHHLLTLLGQGWELVHDDKRLERNFKFINFKEALNFTNDIGMISEEENHHPEIHLGWGHCRIEVWTHINDDLMENDFILAAKITEAYRKISGTTLA